MRFLLTLLVVFVFILVAQTQERPDLQTAFSTPALDLTKKLSPTLQLAQTHPYTINGLKVTPLFCRMENKWEKKAGHGVRFRLGDVQTVNQYEGKANPLSINR